MRFRHNPTFERQQRAEPEFRAGLMATANRVAYFARAAAPKRTLRYLRSIETFDTGVALGVTTTDPFGHLVEWGSVNNPPYAPIRRGAVAAGLELRELPKP